MAGRQVFRGVVAVVLIGTELAVGHGNVTMASLSGTSSGNSRQSGVAAKGQPSGALGGDGLPHHILNSSVKLSEHDALRTLVDGGRGIEQPYPSAGTRGLGPA